MRKRPYVVSVLDRISVSQLTPAMHEFSHKTGLLHEILSQVAQNFRSPKHALQIFCCLARTISCSLPGIFDSVDGVLSSGELSAELAALQSARL